MLHVVQFQVICIFLIGLILYTMFVLQFNLCFQVEVDNYENRDDEVPYLTKNRQGMLMLVLQYTCPRNTIYFSMYPSASGSFTRG